jgi:hypothetical protein
VGGFSFTETVDYPMGRGPHLLNLYPEQTMNLDEARQAFPAPISLPSYVPEGYVLDQDQLTVMVSPDYPFQYVRVRWKKEKEQGVGYLFLSVEHHAQEEGGKSLIIGLDSLEEVTINGQTAALVRGIWNSQTQEWDQPDFIMLRWSKDGLVYDLHGLYTGSLDTLIRMAESIP